MFRNRLYLILIHLILGWVVTLPSFAKLLSLGITFYAFYDVYRSKNSNEEAFLWTSYIVSAEVLFRMTDGNISWEMTKYTVVGLCLLAMSIEHIKRGIPVVFIFYILLIALGMIFSEIPPNESYRKAWIFNLSGPITLGVASLYFYKRKITFNKLKHILFVTLLPVISMLTLLYFRTPDLKEITFGTSANFETSGGFGPNQVATALGYGMFLMAVLFLTKSKISGFLIIDAVLFFYIVFRGLLTFSRGGMMTGSLAFFVVSVFYLLDKGSILNFIKYLSVLSLFTVSIWVYSSNVTGGILTNRYMGQNTQGEEKEDMTSGRIDIFKSQVESFYEHPWFGIGVGSGKFKRLDESEEITAASHNEMGRLLEEHGMIGVLALLLIVIYAFVNMIGQPLYFVGFIFGFLLLWFLTINHSAMRIAFPGYIYALCLLKIDRKQEESLKLEA